MGYLFKIAAEAGGVGGIVVIVAMAIFLTVLKKTKVIKNEIFSYGIIVLILLLTTKIALTAISNGVEINSGDKQLPPSPKTTVPPSPLEEISNDNKYPVISSATINGQYITPQAYTLKKACGPFKNNDELTVILNEKGFAYSFVKEFNGNYRALNSEPFIKNESYTGTTRITVPGIDEDLIQLFILTSNEKIEIDPNKVLFEKLPVGKSFGPYYIKIGKRVNSVSVPYTKVSVVVPSDMVELSSLKACVNGQNVKIVGSNQSIFKTLLVPENIQLPYSIVLSNNFKKCMASCESDKERVNCPCN